MSCRSQRVEHLVKYLRERDERAPPGVFCVYERASPPSCIVAGLWLWKDGSDEGPRAFRLDEVHRRAGIGAGVDHVLTHRSNSDDSLRLSILHHTEAGHRGGCTRASICSHWTTKLCIIRDT